MAVEPKELLTVREAARECRRTAETVRRWIWDGKLPAQKLGNQLFVRRADLLSVLSQLGGGRVGRGVAVPDDARAVRERTTRRHGARGRGGPPGANALEWVSQRLPDLRATYAGQWIAVAGDRVVAASRDLPALMAELATLDVGTPFITEIPAGPVLWHTAYARHNL